MNRETLEGEHAAVTETAGAMPLDRWITVRVTGGDRDSFLHNMCTNDVKGLRPGDGCEAFFTEVKGKIVAHAFILAGEDETLLIAVPDQAGKLIAHLDRYIIREDVQLVDATAEIAWTLLAGLLAGATVDRLAPAASAKLSRAWSHATPAIDSHYARLVRCDLPWCGGYLAGTPSDRADSFRRLLAEANVAECSDDAWKAIRVESAWPLWGVDFDDSNLPQEVGRDAAVINFRKGCYLGQETVARIDALGHVNKKLVKVRFTGDAVPDAGANLVMGKQAVGQVTSAAWSPRFNAPIALAMVRRGANEAGTMLQWNGVPAEVIESPPTPTAA